LFKTKNRSDEDLRSIQVNYAGQSKPATRWSSEFKDDPATGNKNYMKQRYTDTQLYSGKFWSEGGAESFGDWMKRGPIQHLSWVRDASDRSTHCQVNIQYGSIEAGANLFVISHFTRAISVQTEAGFVVDVQSLAV
jgi:hypothetical protein